MQRLTPWFPVVLLAAMAYSCLGWRRATAVFLAASVVFAALMSPWWIRNYLLFDAFVPFSTSAAKNLYLGNNRNNLHAGIDWRTDAEHGVVARIDAIADERASKRLFKGGDRLHRRRTGRILQSGGA